MAPSLVQEEPVVLEWQATGIETETGRWLQHLAEAPWGALQWIGSPWPLDRTLDVKTGIPKGYQPPHLTLSPFRKKIRYRFRLYMVPNPGLPFRAESSDINRYGILFKDTSEVVF